MAIKALTQEGVLHLLRILKDKLVEKETGKGLSTNDFTDAYKTKLDDIEDYTLPAASANTLGGVKIGATMSIDQNGVLNVGSHTHAITDVTGLSDALDSKAAATHTHTANDVGAIPVTDKGARNGVATLDANGLVPTELLPASHDDCVDGYYDATTGEFYEDSAHTTVMDKVRGRLYIDITNGGAVQYHCGGTTYTQQTHDVVAMTNQEVTDACNSVFTTQASTAP